MFLFGVKDPRFRPGVFIWFGLLAYRGDAVSPSRTRDVNFTAMGVSYFQRD